MKKINKKILISILAFFIILLLSISIIMANNAFDKVNIEIDKEKIYYEIKYIDSKILYMANQLNNIENETNFYIDWDKLESQTYILYDYWNSVILDLNYLDVDKKHLTSFGNKLDELLVSIKHKNKSSTLINLIDLYNKLTIYSSSLNFKEYNNILITKYNLLCAYATVENGNWTLAHEYILKASEDIYHVVNSMEVNQYSQYNINQAYVAVRELENLIDIKNVDVFYLKYKLAIDKLENLTFE